MRFVWDERKAKANFKKHGVSFDEASSAFEDKLGAYYPDALHEDRFILIGLFPATAATLRRPRRG